MWKHQACREELVDFLHLKSPNRVCFQLRGISERVSLLSSSKIRASSASTTEDTVTATTAAAASNSSGGGGSPGSSIEVNVPGSGSVLAWRSNFSETQWGSVQDAASQVYLQLRFCTA